MHLKNINIDITKIVFIEKIQKKTREGIIQEEIQPGSK